jgi:hypothetical protein
MFECIDYNQQLIIDLIISIISALVVVPIILKINDYFEFTEFIFLLSEETRRNLELIDELPHWLAEVRTRQRPYLPGKNSNQPQPGYVLKYLSMNIYNTFLNQKYWMYLDRGHADKLSELYEFIRRYCDTIKMLETQENGVKIQRDANLHALNPNLYSYERFLCSVVELPDGIVTNLSISQSMIRHHATKLNIDNQKAFRAARWWYPIWLKRLLRLFGIRCYTQE